MKFTVCKRLRFSAAHQLRNYDGPCANLHGHNYTVEVFMSVEKLNELGMVVDFGRVKSVLGGWLDEHWDHKHITLYPNPTAEVMALALLTTFSRLIPEVRVESIRVWETEDSYAEVSDR